MREIILVGIEYDDFSDGGFKIVAIGSNMEEAEKLAEKYRKYFLAEVKKCPNSFVNGALTQPCKLSFRPATVGAVLDMWDS